MCDQTGPPAKNSRCRDRHGHLGHRESVSDHGTYRRVMTMAGSGRSIPFGRGYWNRLGSDTALVVATITPRRGYPGLIEPRVHPNVRFEVEDASQTWTYPRVGSSLIEVSSFPTNHIPTYLGLFRFHPYSHTWGFNTRLPRTLEAVLQVRTGAILGL